MGTNFYLNYNGETDYENHIGKRSAAGLYCWDCNKSLCKGAVHYGNGYYEACPICGKKLEKETLKESLGGRELGFNPPIGKNKPKRKQGVKVCSSFTWAISPIEAQTKMGELQKLKVGCVIDEYGTEYTVDEFEEVLNECPIRIIDSITETFSIRMFHYE